MVKLLVYELDSEEEECKLHRGVVEPESDITVSTVHMEDFSGFSVTSSETNKEVDVEWNSIPKPIMVNPFVANTVPVRDVSEFSSLDFLHLMLKEENFNQIAEETKLITLPAKRWNLNQIMCGMKLMLKKSKRTLTRTFSLASNNCQKFIRTGLKINLEEFQKCRRFFQGTSMPKYRSTCISMIKEKNCHMVMLTTTNYSKCAPSSRLGCRYAWN